jgi:flagellar biosynthesis/type III secretory pathway protein FliH
LAPEALQDLFERALGPEAKDLIMTAGQRLIQQGFEQGYQEGLELARQRYREIMLRWLRQGFGDAVDTLVEQRIATASFEELETWSTRVVSAATLAD